jgi:hypothetical protein
MVTDSDFLDHGVLHRTGFLGSSPGLVMELLELLEV